MPVGVSNKGQAPGTAEEDDFSSLDYENFDFDDMELLDYSESSSSNVQKPPATNVSAEPSSALFEAPIILPQDIDLVNIILSWLFSSLEGLILARQQALHEKQQQQQQAARTLSTNFANYETNPPGSFTTWGNNSGQNAESSDSHVVSARLASIASMSLEGVWQVLGAHAECSVILVDQHKQKLEDTAKLFERSAWLSPWIQHWRMQDEMVWATRMVENYPRMFLAYEDRFLNLWFRTISIPVHELTTQHRFLHTVLRSTGSIAANTGSNRGSAKLSQDLFKDLPIAHLDHPGPRMPNLNPYLEEVDVDRSLKDTEMDAKLLHEFKESRLQVISKVLCNIGEHYLAVKPTAGTTDQNAYILANQVRSRYQTYLDLLLRQIKRDYEVTLFHSKSVS